MSHREEDEQRGIRCGCAVSAILYTAFAIYVIIDGGVNEDTITVLFLWAVLAAPCIAVLVAAVYMGCMRLLSTLFSRKPCNSAPSKLPSQNLPSSPNTPEITTTSEQLVSLAAHRLWELKTECNDGGYYTTSMSMAHQYLEPSAGVQTTNKPDISRFVKVISTVFCDEDWTEPQIESVVGFLLDSLPRVTWYIEESGNLEQLYHGEGMENAVGYITTRMDYSGPDVDSYCADPARYQNALDGKIAEIKKKRLTNKD
jgi:uncharacterized integral membrane protein